MPDSSSLLYTYSVPLFIRQLEQLSLVLKKGEQWCDTNNVDKKKLLEGRLAEDMLPLTFQVQTCCNTGKGILVRIGGAELEPVKDDETTFSELFARIEKTVEMLKQASKDTFATLDAPSPFHIKIGPQERDFQNPLQYLQNFALPNFFFHMSTAYLILRNAGVDVGKQDFIGASTLTQPSF